jgi:hypothetical protein
VTESVALLELHSPGCGGGAGEVGGGGVALQQGGGGGTLVAEGLAAHGRPNLGSHTGAGVG